MKKKTRQDTRFIGQGCEPFYMQLHDLCSVVKCIHNIHNLRMHNVVGGREVIQEFVFKRKQNSMDYRDNSTTSAIIF